MDYSQAPLSMEFSRQEFWNGLGFPPPRNFPHPGIEPKSLESPALVGGFFITVLLANVDSKDYLSWSYPKIKSFWFLGSDKFSHSKNTFGLFSLTFYEDQNFFIAAAAKLRQSCPTLCHPIDGSPTGSSVPGILQARILEWVAISFSNAWKWKVKMRSHF